MPPTTESRAQASATPKQADYSQAARRLVERCLEQARADSARKARDRQDWWNLLLYEGGENHWKIWDSTSERYVTRGTDPAKGGIPEYIPRCVTNVFAVKVDGCAAILNQTDPAKECGPGSPEEADRAAAEVAQQALPVLFKESGYESDRAQIHKLVCLTGCVGYAVYYDDDPKHGMEEIVAQQCQDCEEFAMPLDVVDAENKCPACGSDQVFDAIDQRTGMPISQAFPKGRLIGKVLHSFELSKPKGARTNDTSRLPWVLSHARMTREEVIGRWPKLKETLAEGNNSPGKTSTPSISYADGMAGLVAGVSSQDGRSGGNMTGPVVYECWHDPIDDGEFFFPEGLYAVLVDEDLADAGPLPFKDEDDRPIKNILIRQYAARPGNAAGKPVADDLGPLQVQRNIVESLIDLSLMHYAAPKEYIPTSVTLIDEPTGAPGERIRYRSNTPGEKPTIEPGRSPAAGLYERLEKIDAKIDELSRLNAVLAGERPEGDPTLGEVTRLEENGLRAFREPLDALVDFEIDLATMMLRVAKQSMWTNRFFKIRGENGAHEVKAFLGADLEGRIDIYIDRASAWPKSPTRHSLRLKEAFEIGLLPQPAAQDPELAGKLFSELDLASLKPSLDVDRKQIERELDKWKAATSPAEIAPPDPLTQNVKLHFAMKQAFLKTEEAEALAQQRPDVYAAMRAHLQMLQQFSAPTPAPGAALDGLVNGGVLRPKTAESGAGVDALVQAHVLRPKVPTPQPAVH